VTRRLAPEARTSLKHVGGATERRGDASIADRLARAFDIDPNDAEIDAAGRAHVHGFHSYPARIHPVTAARLVRAFARKGQTLLDPFCGSGTILVEGRLAGLAVRGTDVNPLAIRLATLKTRGVPEGQRRELLAACRKIAAHAEERRKAKLRVSKKYDDIDVETFEPHVLMELDALMHGIQTLEPKALVDDVELVLSAILTKVSKKRGDTGLERQQRRTAPGFVGRMLVAKCEELVRALEAFERAVPRDTPAPDVHADDARTLGTIGARAIDLVVTSPPYAATYDYVGHHDVRLRWLGLRLDRFEKLELGARRAYARLTHEEAVARWDEELGRTLTAIERSLRYDGIAVLVLADSAVRGGALRADATIDRLAPKSGLEVVAVASQSRPHFHSATQRAFADRARHEHLIAVRPRDPRGSKSPATSS
jgi:adenine-specific DNA methylase